MSAPIHSILTCRRFWLRFALPYAFFMLLMLHLILPTLTRRRYLALAEQKDKAAAARMLANPDRMYGQYRLGSLASDHLAFTNAHSTDLPHILRGKRTMSIATNWFYMELEAGYGSVTITRFGPIFY